LGIVTSASRATNQKENMKPNKRTKSGIKMSGPKVGMTVNFAAVPRIENDGANNYDKELALLASTLKELCSEKTFDVSSALSLSRSLDLEPSHVVAWWNQWLKAQIKAGSIVEIDSCYSSPLYKFK